MAAFCGGRQIALPFVRDYPQIIDPAMEGRPKLRAYVIQECLHERGPRFSRRNALQRLGIPRLLHW
ncbi:hypothetical protein DT070_13180 [Polaromonas sp. SP1]|nr:hypothetical protein DT070_13180 [Polaromonas sp. SP1]